MATRFKSAKLDQRTIDKWAHWLRDCSPLPQANWISGDCFEIRDPERMRTALLADLTGEGASVRNRDALKTDFARFVRAWQVAAWLEEINAVETTVELKDLLAEIGQKQGNYSPSQLSRLRVAASTRLASLRPPTTDLPDGESSVSLSA